MNGRVRIQIQYIGSSLFKTVNPCTKIKRWKNKPIDWSPQMKK